MVFDSRIWKSIILLVFGLILIYLPGLDMDLRQETIGAIIVTLSLLFLISELLDIHMTKKAKPVKINHPEKAKIGRYLERNKIKYRYKPKEESELDFHLPEYDIYVKFWKDSGNKRERDKQRKKWKFNETKFIEIYEDNLETEYKLHSAFMKKGFKLMKLR